MATYYVATGVTGGDGSSGSPWNWDEMTAETFATGDEIIVRTGTHSASIELDTPSGEFFVHGDFGEPRPVIDFGSGFVNRCIDFGGYPQVVDYLEIIAPNAVRAVDVDTWFGCSVNNVKADSWVYVRASRRHAFYRLECPLVQCSAGSISQSYVTEYITVDSTNNVAVDSCVSPKITAASSVGSNVAGSIIYGVGANGGIDFGTGSVSNTIIMDASVGIAANSFGCRADNCLFFNNAANTSGTVVETGSVEMSANPFVDSANGDFRLTTAAKAETYANQLKSIMAGLVDVPGITTDSLADLVGGGGGGSAAFNPYKSAFYRG